MNFQGIIVNKKNALGQFYKTPQIGRKWNVTPLIHNFGGRVGICGFNRALLPHWCSPLSFTYNYLIL